MLNACMAKLMLPSLSCMDKDKRGYELVEVSFALMIVGLQEGVGDVGRKIRYSRTVRKYSPIGKVF